MSVEAWLCRSRRPVQNAQRWRSGIAREEHHSPARCSGRSPRASWVLRPGIGGGVRGHEPEALCFPILHESSAALPGSGRRSRLIACRANLSTGGSAWRSWSAGVSCDNVRMANDRGVLANSSQALANADGMTDRSQGVQDRDDAAGVALAAKIDPFTSPVRLLAQKFFSGAQ